MQVSERAAKVLDRLRERWKRTSQQLHSIETGSTAQVMPGPSSHRAHASASLPVTPVDDDGLVKARLLQQSETRMGQGVQPMPQHRKRQKRTNEK